MSGPFQSEPFQLDPFQVDTRAFQPLAERVRPRGLQSMVGLGAFAVGDGVLARALAAGKPYSMILWGPPGCGKTTLARLVAQTPGVAMVSISAVMAGVHEVREAIERAKFRQTQNAGQNASSGDASIKLRSVLFVDEIHRFNKAQQDALLQPVEDGTLILIGATTENPSFALNNALLSRVRVHVLQALKPDELKVLLQRAAREELHCELSEDLLDTLAHAADGDARRALGSLELAFELASSQQRTLIEAADVEQALGARTRQFDKGEDWHHELVSALHKTLRSSNPDAALYWFARMLDGGADPHYIARRMLRMASEDIGLADPRALEITLAAWQSYERLGSPEGELALAQAVVYLAMAPKSNSIYKAYKAVRRAVEQGGSDAVPNHLRNAPTKLMKSLGASVGYQYDHEHPFGVAFSQRGFPDSMPQDTCFFEPTDRGAEARLRERWQWLRTERAKQSASK
jgi:putative ATPase